MCGGVDLLQGPESDVGIDLRGLDVLVAEDLLDEPDEHFGAHDLRRTCAKLCRKSGGDLEQIKFLSRPLFDPDDGTISWFRAGNRRCCERQFGIVTSRVVQSWIGPSRPLS